MTLEPLIEGGDTTGTEDFAGFVEPHLPTLTWLAACLAPGEHERLLQQALSRAFRRRSRFDPDDGTERAWLAAVLVDESRRLDVRAGSERRLELVVPWPGGVDSGGVDSGGVDSGGVDSGGVDSGGFDSGGEDVDQVDLGRALWLLAEPQRQAVECHHLVGLTVAETAVVLGCSVGDVGSALVDARAQLRHDLLPGGFELTGGHDLPGGTREGLDPDGIERDRNGAADRAVDALLRTAGAQFRAAVPTVVFDLPSSRLSMLGRRGRLGLAGGIVVVVVGIVVAGAGIVRPAATPLASVSSGSPAPDSARADPPPTDPSVAALAEVGPAAELVGRRTAWPGSGLISATPSAAGAAGGVRMAWEVATGVLLVGIPERLLCNDKQVRLRLDGSSALHLDLYSGIGPDQGCAGTALRVLAFAPLRGQNQGESVVTVTGTTGTLVLPGLSGLELDPAGTGAGLPSVSGVRTIGNSPDVGVHWQPETGRLLVSARGCGAFATADLGNGTEVTVVIRPTETRCPGAAETLTHVIQIPPQAPGVPFQVVVFNSTTDRSATTDVFTVPATRLRPGRSLPAEPAARLISLGARERTLTGVDRIGRSAGNTLHFEIDTVPGVDEIRVPTTMLVSDQTVVLSRGTDRLRFRTVTPRAGTARIRLDLPSVSDVHRPLVVRIGDEDVVLPAL